MNNRLIEKFTIIGGNGFIGKNIIKKLLKNKHEVYFPDRDELSDIWDKGNNELGHIVYCAGMTANFRQKPYATIDAHVCLLNRILEKCKYNSLTYLSSTRVYHGSASTNEDAMLQVNPEGLSDLYNLSKLMGENLCLGTGVDARVIRLSNVYGVGSSSSFLDQVFSEVARTGHVVFKTSPESTKDFIWVNDIASLLPSIVLHGEEKIYNVASGNNISNLNIANALTNLGYSHSYEENAPIWSFPEVEIQRVSSEFNYEPSNLLDDIELLINQYK